MEGAIKTIKTIKTNSKSVATLALGILSVIIPVIGIIIGIIGLVLSRKSISEIDSTNETGRGYAVAGLICCIVGISIQLLYVILIALYSISTVN